MPLDWGRAFFLKLPARPPVQALSLTDNPELDYAARFSKDTKRHLRVTVIDLVLATDMSKHFDIITMVKSKVRLFAPAVARVHGMPHETRIYPLFQLRMSLSPPFRVHL